tara:strand:+ start:1285 stop:1905 length:621 start_codon:yes stop_codon:yes gene_type:complete
MILKKASYKALQYACMKFHYAKRIPVSRISYSVFNDNNEWCGVIAYGSGAGNTVAKHFELQQGQCCELVRVALNGKQEQTSKALAISLKLLKKECPLLKLVYSYADVDENHYGIIYQATNWIYLGQSEPYESGFFINGKKCHTRSVATKLPKGVPMNINNIKKYLDENAYKTFSLGKRKYIKIFDKKLFEKYNKIKQDYPKNAIEV